MCVAVDKSGSAIVYSDRDTNLGDVLDSWTSISGGLGRYNKGDSRHWRLEDNPFFREEYRVHVPTEFL